MVRLKLFAHSFEVLLISLLLVALIDSVQGASGKNPPPITNQPPPDINPKYTFDFSQAEEASYALDCISRRNEDRSVISENISLNNPADSEKYRCVRRIYGNLTISADDYGNYSASNDNRVRKFVLPYLQSVSGNLYIEGAAILERIRLPKLYSIGGKLAIDYRRGDDIFLMDSLLTLNAPLEVIAGPQNSFTGMEALTRVDRLELKTDPQDYILNSYSQGYFSGLPNLHTIKGDLEVDLYWGIDSPAFLPSLTAIEGDVEYTLKEGGLIALRQVESIGDDLEVDWNEYYYGSTQGMENLQSVGGDISWQGYYVNNLSGFQSLQTVGGEFNLPLKVADLSDLNSLISVGSLVIDEAKNLASLNGLENVQQLGDLYLRDNASLTSVSALNNASVPSWGDIHITDNEGLSNCSAQSLVKALRGDSNWNTWNSATTQVWGNKSCYSYFKVFSGGISRQL